VPGLPQPPPFPPPLAAKYLFSRNTAFIRGKLSHPGFQNKTRVVICVHTYNKRIEISEKILYIVENIFIITLTNIRVRGNSW